MSLSKEVVQVAWNRWSKDSVKSNPTYELLAAFLIAHGFIGIM